MFSRNSESSVLLGSIFLLVLVPPPNRPVEFSLTPLILLQQDNARIVQTMKDFATKASALHEVKKSERKTKFWFHQECQEQRTLH